MEEVSVYDIKDHAYAKFRLGHVFVRVESTPVCHIALMRHLTDLNLLIVAF